MKLIYLFKFKKYLFFSVIAYIVLYTIYALAILVSKVDLYLIVVLVFVIAIIYWLFTGLLYPPFMPFFKVKKRILVLLFSVLFLSCSVGVVIAVETYIFNRDPTYTVRRNIYYLFHGVQNIHPFQDDAINKFKKEYTIKEEELNASK